MRVCAVEPPAAPQTALPSRLAAFFVHRWSKKNPAPRQRGSVSRRRLCACEISGRLGKAIWRGSPLS